MSSGKLAWLILFVTALSTVGHTISIGLSAGFIVVVVNSIVY